MKREDILGFVVTIIRNGVENNIDEERVKESIVNYGKYLKAQNFADEETIDMVNALSNLSNELLNLGRAMKKDEFVFFMDEHLPREEFSHCLAGIVGSFVSKGKPNEKRKFIPIDMMGDFSPKRKEVEQVHDYSHGPVIGSCLAPSHQPSYGCGSSRPSPDPCSSSRSVSPSTCVSSYNDYSSNDSCFSGRSLGGRSC